MIPYYFQSAKLEKVLPGSCGHSLLFHVQVFNFMAYLLEQKPVHMFTIFFLAFTFPVFATPFSVGDGRHHCTLFTRGIHCWCTQWHSSIFSFAVWHFSNGFLIVLLTNNIFIKLFILILRLLSYGNRANQNPSLCTYYLRLSPLTYIY